MLRQRLLFSSFARAGETRAKQPSCNHGSPEQGEPIVSHELWVGIVSELDLENRHDYICYPMIFFYFSNWKEP